MSISVMTAVWTDGPPDTSDRFVLLALADYANDDGECWPSIAGLMAKTCMSERGVQTVLRRLIAGGFVTMQVGGGRSKTSTYTVKTPHLTVETPHQKPRISQQTPQDAPLFDVETPQQTTETPHLTALNPAPGAPEPSVTIIQPSEKEEVAQAPSSSAVRKVLVEFASPAAVTSFMAYRSRVKGGALTVTGAKRLATHLRNVIDRGGDPDDALGMAEEKGWKSVEPDWYFNAKGKTNGNGHHNNGNPPATGRDSFLDEIAIAARSRPSQGGLGY